MCANNCWEAPFVLFVVSVIRVFWFRSASGHLFFFLALGEWLLGGSMGFE
jgi:hypothetical protein